MIRKGDFKIKLPVIISIMMCYFLCIIFVACNNEPEYILLEEGEEFLGGPATVFDVSVNAFGNPAPNLEGDGDLVFITGNSFFNRNWVTAPASTEDLDGLGPHFNARSCSGCHFKDGKGTPPLSEQDPLVSILFRLSLNGTNENGGPKPDEIYGNQLSNFAVLGVKPEGNVKITYEEITGSFADGNTYSLRKPNYQFIDMGYGEIENGFLFSPRVAPHMVGLGLLEAIDDSTILAMQDIDDLDENGISGKANFVWDEESQSKRLGRFGWKANQPTVRQQTAGAFNGDIGLTTSVFPDESCSNSQQDCIEVPNGGEPEVKESILNKVVFYSSTLAVPKRRDWDKPLVLEGKKIFFNAGCNNCHTPVVKTGTNGSISEFHNLTIRPFTDLLLHDMGNELADGRPDYLANGNEWRTPPLWGIGLIQTVNGHTNFLHDGRARNLEEAILWHNGEAKSSGDYYKNLNESNRNALLAFLNSL